MSDLFNWLVFLLASFLTCADANRYIPANGSLGRTSDKMPTIIPRYFMRTYDKTIEIIYSKMNKSKTKNVALRVEFMSQAFLGEPYLLGALGEGQTGKFDQHPLYRTDKFDCTTYVSTVLALVESSNLKQFKTIINFVRYHYGKPTFLERNHFMSVDWNPVNIENHYIEDITKTLGLRYRIAIAKINKPAWFRALSFKAIQLLKPISHPRRRLNELHLMARKVKPAFRQIPYIPLTTLFTKKNHQYSANLEAFNKIPSGSMIEIVHGKRYTKAWIGTDMNISHMGFVIRTPQGLMFRNASYDHGKVVDEPFIEYLRLAYLRNRFPRRMGISVFKVIR